MITRYDCPEISSIWSETSKYESFLKVELAILAALEKKSVVPTGTTETIRKNAVINPQRIAEIEETTKHDIIAFCSSITERITPEQGRFFHFGVTSSDIIDTAQTLQIRQSLEQILHVFEKLLETLQKKAIEHKDLMAMGRSHGMYAEPLSFGQKLLGHYTEFKRRFKDYQDYFQTELTGQFSGAVGNYTILTPELEQEALSSLGLNIEEVSTQVIPRDRLAKLIAIGGLTASAIERIAVEIRHLHRSEVNELHEGFSKGQKGSSTMPHKKNPISGENLSGMARLLRSHVSMAMENVVLWHERDISHSSTERMYLPDHFGILYYALKRLEKTIANLEVHREIVESRVLDQFVYLSSYYLHSLIKQTTCSREELYALVQAAAFDSQSANQFHEKLMRDLKAKGISAELSRPDQEEIRKIYLSSVDQVFARSL